MPGPSGTTVEVSPDDPVRLEFAAGGLSDHVYGLGKIFEDLGLDLRRTVSGVGEVDADLEARSHCWDVIPSKPSGRLFGTAVRPGRPFVEDNHRRCPCRLRIGHLVEVRHVPRWNQGDARRERRPAKSSISQPLVDVFGAGPGGNTRSIAWTAQSYRRHR